MSNTDARCPLCQVALRSFHHGRTRILPHHGRDIANGDACEASGWLVEDDDLTRERRR